MGSAETESNPPEGRDMHCLLELFSGLPSFLASALSHEHGDARGNLALSRSHTGVFGCHLVYVFLNSRATCLAASSGPSDDRRMMWGGGGRRERVKDERRCTVPCRAATGRDGR